MLGGPRQIGLVNDLPYKPSFGQTAAAAFEKPIEQVSQIHDYIFPGLSTEQSRRETADNISNIDELLSDPRQSGWQQTSNAISGIVGSIIPTLPLGMVGGAVLKAGVGAVGFGARTIASAALAEEGSTGLFSAYLATQVPLHQLAKTPLSHFLPEATIAGIATGTAEAYGFYKGMVIPEHFAENYNAIANTLDKSHAIEDWGADNYGFLLGATPLAAGYVAFKGIRGVIKYRNAMADSKAIDAELTRLLQAHEVILKENKVTEGMNAEKQAKVSELQEHLQQAEDMGELTPEQHEWYLDYLENPNHPDTHLGAMKALTSLQIPYDRITGRVWNEVISSAGVKNLQAALFDQGITNFTDEERQLLSSYITHNELDGYVANMRENPNLLMAIQGMTHGLGLKIAAQSAELIKFHESLLKNNHKTLKKTELFSQDSIYEHLKKIQVYDKSHVPYEVPTNILNKLALERKLKKILSRETLKDEQLYQEGVHNEIKNELKSIKLMSPKEELKDIINKLIPNGKLVSNFKNKKAYYRLEELSQVWPEAKVVLDRIHGEAINAKQKGLNEILKRFTEMVDSNASRLADPDSVKRYLHSRLEKSVPIVSRFERSGIRVEVGEVTESLAVKPEVIFDEESVTSVESSNLKFAKESYDLSKRKYKQFSESAQALEDYITCALGG